MHPACSVFLPFFSRFDKSESRFARTDTDSMISLTILSERSISNVLTHEETALSDPRGCLYSGRPEKDYRQSVLIEANP